MWPSSVTSSQLRLAAAQSAIDNQQSAISNQQLLDRLPCHFLYRRDSVHHFVQTAAAKRDHPFLDRLAPQLQPGCADENQLAQLVADFHHFIEADASFVTRVVAPFAAAALLRDHLLRFLLSKSGFDQRLR